MRDLEPKALWGYFDDILKIPRISKNEELILEYLVDFAKKNATMYADGGYMIDAFNKGADDSAPLARILAAVTDDLWERGYSNEDLAKIYGGNKMRVYQQVWEGAPEGQWDKEYSERVKLRREFMEKYGTR